MDTIQQIDSKITELKELRDKLVHEIDALRKDIDTLKSDTFNVMNTVKMFAARGLRNNDDAFKSVLGETYVQAKNREFGSAQDYIDYINNTISHIRESLSKIDQCVSNLEKCKHDLQYQLESVSAWIAKSDELLT